MKQILALLAIVLGVLAIYRVLEPRLQRGEPTGPPGQYGQHTGPRRISEWLDPHVQAVLGPLAKRNVSDLVTPLTTLRKRLADRQRHGDAAMHPVYAAADQTLAQMIVAAEEKTRLARDIVEIGSKPSALETRTSVTSSKDFFADRVISRWEQQRKGHEVSVNRQLERLREEERRFQKAGGRAPVFEWQVFEVSVNTIKAQPNSSSLDRRPAR